MLGACQALVEFLHGHDFDVPADQLGCQANVLSAAADGQRELVFGHQHNGPAELRIEEHVADLGWLKCIRDKHLQRIVPADNIDALAAQFVDDRFDPAAANADAGADAIDFHIDAGDGNLGPVAGLARHSANLDGAVLNFGNLLLEQATYEVGVAAR